MGLVLFPGDAAHLPILSGCHRLILSSLKTIFHATVLSGQKKINKNRIPIIGNDRHGNAPKFRSVLAEGEGPTADAHARLQSLRQPPVFIGTCFMVTDLCTWRRLYTHSI